MIHPQDFINEYVEPSYALFIEHPTEKHLAVHAIAQIDIVADITADWVRTSLSTLSRRDFLKQFRTQLDTREPALAAIRDIHDSHKHGTLDRRTAVRASQGQRPEVAAGKAFLLDQTRLDGPQAQVLYLAIMLNDGSEQKIWPLLLQGRDAWRRELRLHGLSTEASGVELLTSP